MHALTATAKRLRPGLREETAAGPSTTDAGGSVGGSQRSKRISPPLTDAACIQAPSLHGRYPLPRYYEPVRLPHRAGLRLCLPAARWGTFPTRAGLPGSSTDLSTRAVPFHPGEPDECIHPLLLRRWQASASWADWPLSLWRNEAEPGSLALRLTCSPHEASRRRLLGQRARLATC